MESLSTRRRRVSFSAMAGLALVAGVVLLTGCHRKPAAEAPVAAAVPEANPAANPVYVRPETPTVVAADPSGGPDLQQMTHGLRRWISRTHLVPKNFNDYAAQANLQFPPPPPGKKFSLGPHMTVILVNQ